ncbi:MAG: UDP-glucose 4-epimerase GalE [Pseudomonadota bacterium]
MARILVTGGAGYVGAHASKALAAAGHSPIVFDNLGTGWRDAVRFGPLIEGDLLDPEALDKAFIEARPEAVMHFAALSNVGESAGEPNLYWRNNVSGTLNLLGAMRTHGVGRIVFSSTCATYGEASGAVLMENDPQAPINCYGRTKLAVERMLGDFEAAFGIRHVIFRYFNAAGASPDREIGEHHAPETHLIPLALDAVSGRRGALTIFGTDYPTPDGTCIRDYIHVMDLAEAHLLGVDWLLGGGASLALNLGSGAGFSVREVIDTAASVTGAPCPHVEGARRQGDPPRLVSGSDRAAEVLGWRPRRSDLAEIIADAWAWHQTGKYAR